MNIQEQLTQISKKVRKLRENKKLSQKQLGDIVGTCGQNISHIEHGKVVPTLDMVLLLSETLDSSPNDLVGFEGKTVDEILKSCSEEEGILIRKVANEIDRAYHNNIIR